ncbi:MAG TPA: zinc ABC transporter substrate-binding protein [candidate division Zixibacteria bacterium]|nr:zinc ABC transporter substrate-binding protein [candidate division Zixibacteria bacterium]
MKRAIFIAGLAMVVLLGGITEAKDPSCFVSILPLADFVEQVSGYGIEAEVLVGPGQSPATFEPTPQQMARLVEADLLFVTGMPFEQRLVEKLAEMKTGLKIVDLRQGIDLIKTEESEHENPDHHDHGEYDPHVWLDPDNVKIMAGTIAQALKEIAPERIHSLEAGRTVFCERLDSVKTEVAASLEGLSNRTLYVFHPAYGYFCRAFGLKQVAVEIEGKEPSARQLADLIDRARAEQVKVIFVQPQFSQKSAQAIAEAIGAVVVPIDPLARDYIDNLHEIASRIKEGLSSRGQ